MNFKSANMSPRIRITREFTFEMAHVLWNYNGPCRNLHGHSYKLFVTLEGRPFDDPDNPKNGMVIDFSDIESIVNSEIIDVFDHSVVAGTHMNEEKIRLLAQMFSNIVPVGYQPTCENLVADFAARLMTKLPQGVRLHSVKLYETANSYAEWHASDNE